MAYIDISREEDFARIPDDPADDVTVNLWNDVTVRGRWAPLKGHNITFNGQHHTLRGLTGPLFAKSMTSDGADDIASEDITVNNLRVYVDVTDTDRIFMGGLTRLGRRFKAVDCAVYGNFICRAPNCGVVAGMIDDQSELTRCVAYGTIKVEGVAEAVVGGLVGRSSDSRICGSVSHAVVSTTGSIAGGIAGSAESTFIETCENYGAVNAAAGITGGIVGLMLPRAHVIRCTNNADVSGGDAVGGISGASLHQESVNHIMNCTNTGIVAADSLAGGIIGAIGYGMIQVSNNLNTADVRAEHANAGGILGGISRLSYIPTPPVEAGTAYVKNNMVSCELIHADTDARRIAGSDDPAITDLQLHNNQAYYHMIIEDDVSDHKYILEDNPLYGSNKPHGASTVSQARLPANALKPFLAPPPPKPWPKRVIVNGKCIPAPPPIPEWFKGIQCGVRIVNRRRTS
jgi:hypothetical protein